MRITLACMTVHLYCRSSVSAIQAQRGREEPPTEMANITSPSSEGHYETLDIYGGRYESVEPLKSLDIPNNYQTPISFVGTVIAAAENSCTDAKLHNHEYEDMSGKGISSDEQNTNYKENVAEMYS